jgi:hypothetical protein
MMGWKLQPKWLDSTKQVSGKPGAVQLQERIGVFLSPHFVRFKAHRFWKRMFVHHLSILSGEE